MSEPTLRPQPNSATLALPGAIAALLGAATYSSFLLGPLTHSHLSATSSFVSELEAAGQPYEALFRLSDVISGLSIIVVAGVLYRMLRPDRLLAGGCVLVALTGAASVGDGTTEMGCAPSLDPACKARDSTVPGLLSQTFESHTLTGLVGFLGGAGGMILLGVALRRRSLSWGTASVGLGIVLAAVGLIDLGLLAAQHWFGLAERARALVVSLWLVGAGGYFAQRLSQAGRATVGGSYPSPASSRGLPGLPETHR